MKIGIFSDCYAPQINGVVTSITILKKQLEELGHEVYIVTTTDPKVEQDRNDVIRLHSVPFLPLKNFRVAGMYSHRVYRQLKEIELDVIHTQTEFGVGLFGMIMAKKLDIPAVHTYHTMYEDYCHYIYGKKFIDIKKKFVKKYSSYFSNKAQKIIVPTAKVKNKLLEYGGVEKNIFIIPTGIDYNNLKGNTNKLNLDQLKRQLGIEENDKILLSLGRVAKEKSIDNMLKAMPQIISKREDIKLLIVGAGPELKNLKKLADELNINSHVIFTGEVPRDNVSSYYKLGDLFVNCSTSETQGLTLFEAMSIGLPVVTKYDYNLDDFIKNDENAIVYKDNEDLPKVIIQSIDKDNQHIIHNAYKTTELISADKFGHNIEKVYFELIKEHKLQQGLYDNIFSKHIS